MTIQMNATEQFSFPCDVVDYAVQGGFNFEFFGKILKCGHSHEIYSAVLSCGAVYYAVQSGSNF